MTRTNNGYTTDCLDTFITPSLKEDIPRIHLPGDLKFSSYKTSFQEFCQKKHLTVPTYKVETEGELFRGSVSFSLNLLRCKETSPNLKEAEQRAAFEALQDIGYLQGVNFEMFNMSRKRKSIDDLFAAEDAKQAKIGEGNLTFKGQLNQLAQRKKLSLPTYTSRPVNGGFTASVKFNGFLYKSTTVCTKRKAAEQLAAEVAVDAFSGDTE